MRTVVQKYGGSSVETTDLMENVASRVIEKIQDGYKVVVVVSAMGKTTNHLIEMAKSIAENPDKRELDMLMASGEQVSASLLSITLKEKGFDSVSLTGFQAGIKTKGFHTKNKIVDIDVERIKNLLEEGKSVIVAGFQGINEEGDITTLGRGGSDTTAVALAARLSCACEIYTDVDGIYGVDPRIYAKAKKLDFISYEEMMEMSSLGSKVMEPRSVELGYKYKVPIYVASSKEKSKGTYIKELDGEMEEKAITGLSISDNVLMVTINHMKYSASNIAKIFNLLAFQGVNVDMISQTSPVGGYANISFTVQKEDESTVDEVLEELSRTMEEIHYEKNKNLVKLSVVGMGMRNEPGVASKMFELFADNGIEFKQVTTSEISISYTIDRDDKEKAAYAICEAFGL